MREGIEDEETLCISKFVCEYRATSREELTQLLQTNGCRQVAWKYPEETGFYQPIIVARKQARDASRRPEIVENSGFRTLCDVGGLSEQEIHPLQH